MCVRSVGGECVSVCVRSVGGECVSVCVCDHCSQVSEAGVHRPHVAGIHGRENEGAYSIVLSGGYEDDRVSDVISCT